MTLLLPPNHDPNDPDILDVRHISSEDVERLNSGESTNSSSVQPQQPQEQQESTPWEWGWVTYWAVFSLPGLFCILGSGTGFIAAVFYAFLFVFIGTVWAALCPFQNTLVKNGILLFGCFTLISAVIGLFIPPGYLFIIAIAVAAHAVYKAISGKTT